MTTTRYVWRVVLGFIVSVATTISMPRQSLAAQNVVSLTCAQDARSIWWYNVWVNLTNGLLTYQYSSNGQIGAVSTESATITPTEFSVPGIRIDRTTGNATFTLNGYQEMSCRVSNLPLPQPQTKF